MILTKDDIEFVAKKTKLSIKKAKLLMEEPDDLNLVLNELSMMEITREDCEKLSFETIVKYIIFKFSNLLAYPLSEKSYICQVIVKHFPYISRSKEFKPYPKIQNNNQDYAEYCLILLGFFSHRLKPEQYRNYKKYLEFYRQSEHLNHIFRHLDQWFEVFNKMKKTEIFS